MTSTPSTALVFGAGVGAGVAGLIALQRRGWFGPGSPGSPLAPAVGASSASLIQSPTPASPRWSTVPTGADHLGTPLAPPGGLGSAQAQLDDLRIELAGRMDQLRTAVDLARTESTELDAATAKISELEGLLKAAQGDASYNIGGTEQLAQLAHAIEAETERLAAKVRAGEMTSETAVAELFIMGPRALLLKIDGLYRDFRISPAPGWSSARRLVWGAARLLRIPHCAGRHAFLHVDYASAKTELVPFGPGPANPPPPNTVRFVFVSDTHLRHRDLVLPAGDVLVHSGDILLQGGDLHPSNIDALNTEAVADFDRWLAEEKRKGGFGDVLVTGGNHDRHLQKIGREASAALLPSATFLDNASTTVAGGRINVYGSGYSLGHRGRNNAFQCNGEAAEALLAQIPGDGEVDLLITHGPPLLGPKGLFTVCSEEGVAPIPDAMLRATAEAKTMAGCKILAAHISDRIRPKVHVFGHEHSLHGAHRGTVTDTLFLCASSAAEGTNCAENPAVVIDFPVPEAPSGRC